MNIVRAVPLLLAAIAPAIATATQIAEIQGYYDVDAYDTPSLSFRNTSAFAFTGVTITLTGYQGDNKGRSAWADLPDIAAGSTLELIWGTGCQIADAPCATSAQSIATTSLNISGFSTFFANDYDDTDGGHACLPNQAVDTSLCGQPGNFYVTFTATWNGEPVYSQFSPDNLLPGAGNEAGQFAGWEGLSPDGLSEDPDYDSHNNGGPAGVLAYISAGEPPALGTPEPATVLTFGAGLVAIALRRKRCRGPRPRTPLVQLPDLADRRGHDDVVLGV